MRRCFWPAIFEKSNKSAAGKTANWRTKLSAKSPWLRREAADADQGCCCRQNAQGAIAYRRQVRQAFDFLHRPRRTQHQQVFCGRACVCNDLQDGHHVGGFPSDNKYLRPTSISSPKSQDPPLHPLPYTKKHNMSSELQGGQRALCPRRHKRYRRPWALHRIAPPPRVLNNTPQPPFIREVLQATLENPRGQF